MNQQQTRYEPTAARDLVGAILVALDRVDESERERDIHSLLTSVPTQRRVALAAGEDCPVPVIPHLLNDRPEVQEALAANPVFTGRVLRRVVTREPWRFGGTERNRPSEAGFEEHPRCPDDNPDLHPESLCWFNIARWLLHPDLPLGVFRRELADRGPVLVATLVASQRVRPEHLQQIVFEMQARLAPEASGQVGGSQVGALGALGRAVQHPDYPQHFLLEHVWDPRREIREAAAGSPNLTVDLVLELVERDGATAVPTLLANRAIGAEHIEAAVSVLDRRDGGDGESTTYESGLAPAVGWLLQDQDRALLSLLADPRCQMATVRTLADHPSQPVREEAQLKDPATDVDALGWLLVESEGDLAHRVSAHRNATPELLLPYSESQKIKEWLLDNPSTSALVLLELVPMPGTDLEAVLKHRHVTKPIVWKILEVSSTAVDLDLSPGLVRGIVGCSAASEEMLVGLLAHDSSEVHKNALAAAEKLPWRRRSAMLPKVGARAREGLLRTADDQQYRWAVTHEDSKVRYTAAKLGRDLESLRILSKDPNGHVRRAASQALLALL